jgi:hypothetical protein
MLWKIFSYRTDKKLPMLLIEAESLDKALAEARKVSSDYDAAQLVDYDEESYLVNTEFIQES